MNCRVNTKRRRKKGRTCTKNTGRLCIMNERKT